MPAYFVKISIVYVTQYMVRIRLWALLLCQLTTASQILDEPLHTALECPFFPLPHNFIRHIAPNCKPMGAPFVIISLIPRLELSST
jgi:hypothetical protein